MCDNARTLLVETIAESKNILRSIVVTAFAQLSQTNPGSDERIQIVDYLMRSLILVASHLLPAVDHKRDFGSTPLSNVLIAMSADGFTTMPPEALFSHLVLYDSTPRDEDITHLHTDAPGDRIPLARDITVRVTADPNFEEVVHERDSYDAILQSQGHQLSDAWMTQFGAVEPGSECETVLQEASKRGLRLILSAADGKTPYIQVVGPNDRPLQIESPTRPGFYRYADLYVRAYPDTWQSRLAEIVKRVLASLPAEEQS